jgi:hypothetical protein
MELMVGWLLLQQLMLAIGWALFGAVIGLAVARTRGFDKAETALGGALLGPFAFVMYLLRSENVRCPSCTEWVPPKALVCKHCQRDLADVPGLRVAASRHEVQAPKTAVPRTEGGSVYCGNAACGRLLRNPTDPCRHCGTLPVRG